MQSDEFQKEWKKLDTEIQFKPKEELRKVLEKKIRQTMNRFYFFGLLSVIISAGVLVFLLITALNRSDIWYRLNNLLIGLLVLISLIGTFWSWNKMRSNKNNLSLKNWLEQRIFWLKKWINRSFVWYVLPVFILLTMLAINVYYEDRRYLDVFTDEETMWGLLFGFLAAMFVSVLGIRKTRKYQRRQLHELEELHQKLEKD